MAGFYGRTGIKVTGNLVDKFDDWRSNARSVAEAAVEAGGEIIRAAAYENANVSPGVTGNGVGGEHMRDEIRVEIINSEDHVDARIGINMQIIPYAAHQEFGPHGNGFLRRALDETRDEAHAKMKQVFSAGIGTDGKYHTSVQFRKFA